MESSNAGLNRRSQRNLSSIRDAQFCSVPATLFLVGNQSDGKQQNGNQFTKQQNLEHIRNNQVVSYDVRNYTINYTDHYTIDKHTLAHSWKRELNHRMDHSSCSGNVIVFFILSPLNRQFFVLSCRMLCNQWGYSSVKEYPTADRNVPGLNPGCPLFCEFALCSDFSLKSRIWVCISTWLSYLKCIILLDRKSPLGSMQEILWSQNSLSHFL